LVVALLAAAAVVALPVAAQFVNGSADDFRGRSFAFLPAVGWLVCASLVAVITTRRVQMVQGAEVEAGSVLALAYDALPVLLAPAWVIAVLAALGGHLLLAAVALGLCAYHVILVVPRLVASSTPSWVAHAPRLELVVANVFVDNRTPADAAAQLVESGGDVLVIVESTADFMTIFDDAGGREAYPNRVVDPDIDSDYAVAVVTGCELGPRTEFRRIGPLRVAIADIAVDGISTLLVALNPMATLDPGGHDTWMEQLQVLAEFLPTLTGPVIIAGDLNSTRYRPEFEEIMSVGFVDAIDSLGKGLKPSFKLMAGNAVGAVVRLDHALTNDQVHAVSMRNLEACGSDHLPFVLELAVRPHQHTTTSEARWTRTGTS
jgi:endonuclease/exonuclease/phosphatase (EEP) superfamily protein YafD